MTVFEFSCKACANGSAEEIFELDAGTGFGVAVFDDHGRLKREAPLLACCGGYSAGTWNDYGVFGDDERLIVFGGVDLIADQIVNGEGTVQNRAGAEDSAALHDGAFVDSGVASN